jgi:hypothetical protein
MGISNSTIGTILYVTVSSVMEIILNLSLRLFEQSYWELRFGKTPIITGAHLSNTI